MVTQTQIQKYADWQLRHYAAVGEQYGKHDFTRTETPYTRWILTQIASVKPDAGAVAEVGAGTCVFSSLLGKKLQLTTDVVCYEPVKEVLKGSTDYDNIEAVCGDAADFAQSRLDDAFDLIFTKDAAHHFPANDLDRIHSGFCRNLAPEGRYLMVVRTPPRTGSAPIGSIAQARWPDVYTPLTDLLASMRRISSWTEVEVTQWRFSAETSTREWIDGVKSQNSWSIFSTLSVEEIARTVEELEQQFHGMASFDFLHEYDVAVFEKAAASAAVAA